MDNDDRDLLRRYREDADHAALDTLVRRHLDFVYSSALRQVRDPHLAEDVTQAVFMLLTQKARALKPGVIVSGWLFRATKYCAANALKTGWRRKRRERAVAAKSEPSDDETATWQDVVPELDAALGRLSRRERDLILLSFFERQSAEQIGMTLGLSTGAARKRVDRAVMKLRKQLQRAGVTVLAGVLMDMMSEHGTEQAPALLMDAVLAATRHAAGASVGAATIAKGAAAAMTWVKLSAALVATAAVLTIGAASAALIIHSQARARADVADFPELVGCRLKYVLRVDPASHTPTEVSLPANSHLQIEWAGDTAAQATDFRLAFYPEITAPPGEPLWKSLMVGDYNLTIAAMRGNAQLGSQEIPLHVTPAPNAQIFVNDHQRDGSIRFQEALQSANRQDTAIEDGLFTWGFSTIVSVENITDDRGREITFFSEARQNGEYWFYHLNDPVAPGEAVLIRIEGVMPGAIRDIGGGRRRYELVLSPGSPVHVRRVDIHRLPAGAQLISTVPADLRTRTFAGRTEVVLDETVPPHGSLLLRIDYRITDAPASK